MEDNRGMTTLGSMRVPVPICDIQFHCPYVYPPKKKKKISVACDGGTTQNAYFGPVHCVGTKEKPHPPTFMIPIRMVTSSE